MNTPPESLTPPNVANEEPDQVFQDREKTAKKKVTFAIDYIKKNDDAFFDSNGPKQLLPTPPPLNHDYNDQTKLYDQSSWKNSVLIDHDLNKENDKPPITKTKKEDNKWCQRCGTITTPRWRYGPGGPLTLCNACHLRWKNLGKPLDGYSCENFPPPNYDPSTSTTKKRTWIKKKQITVKRKRLPSPLNDDQIKRKKLALSQTEKVMRVPPVDELPSKTTVTTISSDLKENIPICTQCKTSNTSQWRRGPLGHKTLCNACGLRWAKNPGSLSDTIKKTKSTIAPTKIEPAETTEKPIKKIPNSSLLRYRKEYIKRGLYSLENRVDKADISISPFSIPLPIHLGEHLISTVTDFELPCDIMQERELGLVKGLMADRQPFFTKIRSNIFVERKPHLKSDEQTVCHCIPPTNLDQLGCGEDCINRMLFYECDPKLCPCGTRCSNQRFQRKQKKKGLQIFQTNSRGWGLKTNLDIKKGDLVIEYRGEIISHELCEERMCTTYVNEKNFYFLDYCNGEVIDACTKGTEARFINHSCEPNCHIEKWSLKGESHFGVFASMDIKANSELFYDYNFSSFNDSVEGQQKCYCGSISCRGTIGKKSTISNIK